jgi:hypothetical protein
MQWLREASMVATRKTTRGNLITICKYDSYQDASDTASDTVGKRQAEQSGRYKQECLKNEQEVLGNLIEKFDITVDSDFDKVFDQPFFEWLKLQKGWDAHRAKRALKQFASYKASKKQEIDTVKALRGGALVYLNYENIKQQFK